MGLNHYNIWMMALLTSALAVVVPQIAPSVRLIFFAPLLVTLFYQKSLSHCLIFAVGAGVVVDLISSEGRLGIHAINYCLTTSCLYSQRKNFFADSTSTLTLMTLFFSLLSSALELFVVRLYTPLSWLSVANHLLLMPPFDALFAFLTFTLPALLFGKRQLKGKDYFIS